MKTSCKLVRAGGRWIAGGTDAVCCRSWGGALLGSAEGGGGAGVVAELACRRLACCLHARCTKGCALKGWSRPWPRGCCCCCPIAGALAALACAARAARPLDALLLLPAAGDDAAGDAAAEPFIPCCCWSTPCIAVRKRSASAQAQRPAGGTLPFVLAGSEAQNSLQAMGLQFCCPPSAQSSNLWDKRPVHRHALSLSP